MLHDQKGRRKDRAFISIKIAEEAKPLIEKYLGVLPSKYTNHEGLDTALSKGLKDLRDLAGVPDITFYWVRHSFASLARNSCCLSKDDVALALIMLMRDIELRISIFPRIGKL